MYTGGLGAVGRSNRLNRRPRVGSSSSHGPPASSGDSSKNRAVKRKHGVSPQQIFDQAHLVDQRNDDPRQYRATGWSRGGLCSVIFEIRRDEDGEYYHLVTAWKATREEEKSYAENI